MTANLAPKMVPTSEDRAELEPLDGSLWHAYRRKWATERKHLPDTDVAAAGGWSDLTSLKTAYQQVDAETNTYELIKIVIPKAGAKDCLRYLNRMNINHATLFPDLYGASLFCNMELQISKY